jgi:hypothetical protein
LIASNERTALLETNVVYIHPPEPTLRDELREAIEIRRGADDRARPAAETHPRADQLMCEHREAGTLN